MNCPCMYIIQYNDSYDTSDEISVDIPTIIRIDDEPTYTYIGRKDNSYEKVCIYVNC